LTYFLQVTAFVALLALDQRRVEAGRLDVAPCARLPALLSSLAAAKTHVAAEAAEGDQQPASGYQSLADRGFGGGDDPSLRGGTLGGHSPLLALPLVAALLPRLLSQLPPAHWQTDSAQQGSKDGVCTAEDSQSKPWPR